MKSKKNVILFLLVILSLLFIFVSCSPEEEPEEPVKVVKTHANLRSYKGSFIYKDGKYDTSLIQGDDIKINEYGKVSGTLYKREWSGEAWEDGKKSGYYLALEVYGLENNASYSFSLGLNDRVNAKYRDSYNSFYTYNGTSSSNQYLIYIDENKKGSIVSFKFGNSPERNLDFSSVTFVDNDSYDINSKKLSAIKSEEELKTALNNGGDYFLSSDVAVSSDLTFAKTIDIDLDGKKITSSGSFIISSSPDATDTTIKLSNGNISFSKASANDYAISVGSNTSFTLESVNVESNCNGITIPSSSSGSVTLNSSKVDLFDGNYGIYMDGEGGSVSVDGSDITLHDSGEKDDSGIVVTNGNFGNTTAIFFGQSGNLTINNTTLSSSRQAVVMTAGSGKVENSTLKVSGNNTNDQYLTTDWGSGNEVPLAVLVVGNRVTDAKDITLELTNVTLKKTRLINKSTYEYSTIYVYQNDNTDVRVSGNLSSDSSKLVNTDDNSGHYPAYSVGGGKDDTLFSPTINIKTYDNANNTATIEIIPSKNNPSDVSYKAYVSYDVVDEDDSGDTILDNDGNATIKERIEREDVSASISGTTITLSKQKKIQDLVVVASKDGYSDSPDSVKLQIGGTEKNKLSTPEFIFEKSNEDSDKINAKFRSTYDREFSVVDENGNSITPKDDSDGTFSFEVNKDLTEHTYTIIAEPTDVNLYDNSAPQTLTQSVKKLTTPTVSNLQYGEENGTKYATVDITTADSVSDIKFSLSATSNLVENTTSTYRIDLTQDIQELTVYAYVEGDEYERSLKTTSIKIKPISPISLDTPSIKEEISSNTSSYVFSINEVKNASSYEVKLGNASISELNGKYSVNYKTTPQSVVITAKGDGEFYQDSTFNLTVKGKLATPSFTASYANNDTFILTAVPVDNAGGYLVKVGNKTLTPGSDGKYTEKLKSEMQTITVVAQPSDSTNYIDSEAQSLSIKGKIAVPTIGNIKEDRSQGIVYFEVSNVSNLGTLKVELHDDSTSSVITPATSGDYTGKYVVNIDTTKAQSIRAMVEVKSENSSAYFSSNYVTSKILQGIEEPQITTLTLDNEVYFKIDNKEEGVSYSVIAVNADDENDKTSLSEMAEGDYVGYYRLLYKPNRQKVSFVGRKTSSRYDSKTVTMTISGKLSSPKFVPSFDDTNTQMLLATVAVPNATSYEVIVEGTTHISPDTDGIYSITLGNTEQIVGQS